MKDKTPIHIFILNGFLIYLVIILSIAVGSLLKENSTLRATPVATCPTPIVTMEQLEQAGFQMDKSIFLKVSQK